MADIKRSLEPKVIILRNTNSYIICIIRYFWLQHFIRGGLRIMMGLKSLNLNHKQLSEAAPLPWCHYELQQNILQPKNTLANISLSAEHPEGLSLKSFHKHSSLLLSALFLPVTLLFVLWLLPGAAVAAADVYLCDPCCLASKHTILVWTDSMFLLWAFSISASPLNHSWLMKVRPWLPTECLHTNYGSVLREVRRLKLWTCMWFWRSLYKHLELSGKWYLRDLILFRNSKYFVLNIRESIVHTLFTYKHKCSLKF